jgi:hypothetical protein
MNYKEELGDRLCPLQVGIKKIQMKVDDGKTAPKIEVLEENNSRACIEPWVMSNSPPVAGLTNPSYDHLPRFSQITLETFKRKMLEFTGVNLVPSDSLDLNPRLEILEPGLSFKTPQSPDSPDNFSLSLFITLDNDFIIEIPDEEMKRYLKGLDPDGQPADNRSYTEILVFNKPNPANASSLGRSYLSQVG